MEGRLHYVCHVRRNGAAVFVVWYSGDRGGFLRDAQGLLRAVRTPDTLTAEVEARGVALADTEPTDYDFDRISAWCAAPSAAGVDCPAFLNAWNYFDDLAGLHCETGTPYTRLSRGAVGCYDKLFWGNNLPAVTPPGERFDPAWEVEELDSIRRVMEAGLELLEAELQRAGGRAEGSASSIE